MTCVSIRTDAQDYPYPLLTLTSNVCTSLISSLPQRLEVGLITCLHFILLSSPGLVFFFEVSSQHSNNTSPLPLLELRCTRIKKKTLCGFIGEEQSTSCSLQWWNPNENQSKRSILWCLKDGLSLFFLPFPPFLPCLRFLAFHLTPGLSQGSLGGGGLVAYGGGG